MAKGYRTDSNTADEGPIDWFGKVGDFLA